jgi:sugar O-acyltransferase (sialic acid O-acetyltransferase NeuD family)
MPTPILVVGAGGHAGVVIDILAQDASLEIAGLLDDSRPPGHLAHGYAVLGCIDDAAAVCAGHGIGGIAIAIGDNWNRGAIAGKIAAACGSVPLVSAIHPRATVAASACIGAGAAVMAGAVVANYARIGSLAIVNTAASVDHDCDIGALGSIGPRAVLGGRVTVGPYSAVGIGAVVLENVRIAGHTVVGAGAVVLRDLPPCVVAYGCPARVIRERAKNEPYLR